MEFLHKKNNKCLVVLSKNYLVHRTTTEAMETKIQQKPARGTTSNVEETSLKNTRPADKVRTSTQLKELRKPQSTNSRDPA